MLSVTPNLHYHYTYATPYKFLMLDGFMPEDELTAAADAWPPDSDDWHHYQRNKRGHFKIEKLPPAVRTVLDRFTSPEFVDQLRALTDIPDLVADPTFSEAGLHEVERGGALGIHVDFNRLGPLYRRVNCLLYMNRAWDPAWHGNLVLQSHPKDAFNTVEVEPHWNRLVIFEASENSWHGHPEPLKTPEGVTRRSIAAYYYSPTPHGSYAQDHCTIYG